VRNEGATLPDPTGLTNIADAKSVTDIIGVDVANRQPVSILVQDEFQDKVKVMTIMGSWCPNCMDEARFLDSLADRLDKDQVAIFGLAFERMSDTARALRAISRFGESLELNYPIYYGGSTNKEDVAAKLTFIDELRSYPTLLIIDRQNQIRYVHTGFAGPATSEYPEFAAAFAKTLQTIVNE
jgi:thiol-disulfide isomerase/thioredoxin